MVSYTLKRSTRAKYMRLTVQAGGTVVLTVPHRVPEYMIEKFLAQHTEWIVRGIKRMQDFKPMPVSGRRSYLKHKEEARAFITERVAHWNHFYRFPFGRIAIKDTKRVWGSCSRKGNLNFSYALLFLPRELADYVVVHELSHLQEHNHGPRFWALMATTLPDFKARRADLRRYLPGK
jgi:predicted metal-dependent hydrolase